MSAERKRMDAIVILSLFLAFCGSMWLLAVDVVTHGDRYGLGAGKAVEPAIVVSP